MSDDFPRKVINISQNHRIISGADRYFFALADLLEANGHEVVPYAARHDDDRSTPYRDFFPPAPDYDGAGLGVAIRHLYSQKARSNLRSLLREAKPDLAHLHLYYGKLTPSILRPLQSMDIPIVQTMHDYKLVCPVYTLFSGGSICQACEGHAFWNAAAKSCNRGSRIRSIGSSVESYISRGLGDLRHVDRFLAVSQFVAGKLVELGVPAEKVVTVPNFIDSAEIEQAPGLGDVVLYVGRLERVKGIFTLFEAARSLPDLQVVYAGTGNDEAELQERIESFGVTNVRLVGFKSGRALDELYRQAMFSVVPSEWYEPFGLVILESFARGRPVVASRIGGIPEVVTDDVDGVLVPAGEPQVLADEIERLAGDPARRRRMAEEARKKAETSFAPEEHYRSLRAVYENFGR